MYSVRIYLKKWGCTSGYASSPLNMTMLPAQVLNSKEHPKNVINCNVYIPGSKLCFKNNNQNFWKICFLKKKTVLFWMIILTICLHEYYQSLWIL